jgi:hypothetical protein
MARKTKAGPKRGPRITPKGVSGPDQSLTVDRDAWMEKDIRGASNPDTVWKMADGTEIRPSQITDLIGGAKPKKSKAAPPVVPTKQ